MEGAAVRAPGPERSGSTWNKGDSITENRLLGPGVSAFIRKILHKIEDIYQGQQYFIREVHLSRARPWEPEGPGQRSFLSRSAVPLLPLREVCQAPRAPQEGSPQAGAWVRVSLPPSLRPVLHASGPVCAWEPSPAAAELPMRAVG